MNTTRPVVRHADRLIVREQAQGPPPAGATKIEDSDTLSKDFSRDAGAFFASCEFDDEEAEDRVDNWLNTSGLWAIGEKRYAAAKRILTYANSQRLAKDSCQLMVLVNLAQTHKWRGNEGNCVALLKTRDWAATNGAFRLCVAVLRDEPLDVVEALMKQAVKEDQVSLDSVYEWPVFQRLRKQPGFTDILKSVFGNAADRQVEPFPPRLLDLSANARLDKIFKQLEEIAKAGGTQLKLEASKPKATNSGT